MLRKKSKNFYSQKTYTIEMSIDLCLQIMINCLIVNS